ncbi:MAG: alpha/beta fold hydrolase [Pseudonocardiales bacterium]|nr:alpha/beta fold hydrolase [Pseudonocardiales bacterium]MBV9728194.1 alpha/beta fold hydrolase [Pseudonocardiales bacterium]
MKRAPALSVGLALAAVASLALACTSAAGTTPRHGPVGPVPAGLERFYGQHLAWGGCSAFAKTPSDRKTYADPGLQCAYLSVPLDYANLSGRVIKVGLLRRPASDPAHRVGSLVINPGGPGASGMSNAASLADAITDNDVGRRFDFVGFDPRGVGSSEPQVVCRNAEVRDRERLMNLNVDTSPDGVAKTEAQEKADDEGCVRGTGKDVLANIGTREVVRDMDVMRSALGDEKLTYLGYSYGTRIGTSYAETFPKNVRAMILDGAVDPAQDSAAQLVDQGRGFQKAFDAFAAWCAGRADCALGQDKSQAVSKFQALVRPLINQPVGVSDGRKLSYTDATIGTVQALYLSDLWPMLNRGLQELAQSRGDVLMRLADNYYGRSQDGTYSTEMDVFQAVLCVDNPPIKDPNVARNIDAQYRKVAPFLDTGQPPSAALDNCAFWPVPPTGAPHHPQTPGLPTTMVISTTQDPATPYQAGVNLAHDLNARLLTFDSTQHTAFLQGNSCVDHAGITYLTSLKLPAEGTRCEPAS